MRRLAILGIIVCVGLLVGSAAVIGGSQSTSPPPGKESRDCCTVYRFVGLTENLTTGNGGNGRIGMNAKCRAEFQGGARMCTSEEFFASSLTTELTATYAWIDINPVAFQYATYGTDSVLLRVLTTTGDIVNIGIVPTLRSPAFWTANCDGWTADSPDREGSIIREDGILRSLECNIAIPVACCAPMQPSP